GAGLRTQAAGAATAAPAAGNGTPCETGPAPLEGGDRVRMRRTAQRLQVLLDRPTSGNARSGSISPRVTSPESRVTVTEVLPASQCSTGTVRCAVRPSPCVIVSSAGIGTRPRSSITIVVLPVAVVTLATAWSRVQVSWYQLRQNQSRSCPLTSSNVRHRSHGYGCLYF